MKFIEKKLVKMFEPMAFRLIKASYDILTKEEKENHKNEFNDLNSYILFIKTKLENNEQK